MDDSKEMSNNIAKKRKFEEQISSEDAKRPKSGHVQSFSDQEIHLEAAVDLTGSSSDPGEQSSSIEILPGSSNVVELSESNDPEIQLDADVSRLVSLSEDVLLIILSYLDHHSLCQLKETCTLFARLSKDYTLWRRVKYSYAGVSPKDLDFITEHISSETKAIEILGQVSENDDTFTLTADWFKGLLVSCQNLEVLSLRKHSFDCREVTINSFSSSLTSLDLSETVLRHPPDNVSYFRNVSTILPNLKVLSLSHCAWFEPHSLMAISKCPNLEELFLNDCVQMKECLAYCGLSTRGGFKKLITLDLRRCQLSNSEILCFSTLETVKNLYLECTDFSTFIDPALVLMCTCKKDIHDHVGKNKIVIERFIMRNFKLIRDVALLQLAVDALSLKYLDITGCNISSTVIASFKSIRPDVCLVYGNNQRCEDIET